MTCSNSKNQDEASMTSTEREPYGIDEMAKSRGLNIHRCYREVGGPITLYVVMDDSGKIRQTAGREEQVYCFLQTCQVIQTHTKEERIGRLVLELKEQAAKEREIGRWLCDAAGYLTNMYNATDDAFRECCNHFLAVDVLYSVRSYRAAKQRCEEIRKELKDLGVVDRHGFTC